MADNQETTDDRTTLLEGSSIKPLNLLDSTLLFIVPGILTGALLMGVFPALLSMGVDYWDAFYGVTLAGFGQLFIVAYVMYRKEGLAFDWQTIKTRLRIKKMTGKAWLYTFLAYIVVLGAYLGLLFTAQWYKDTFGVADWYIPPEQGDVVGLYSLILLRFVLVSVNVFAEEFLWRGIILPRQELVHGKNTWWIHGTQWTLYHLFKPWEFLMLWPGCLAYGWVCTKTQNTTPGILLHFGLNGLGVIMVTLAVFGVIS